MAAKNEVVKLVGVVKSATVTSKFDQAGVPELTLKVVLEVPLAKHAAETVGELADLQEGGEVQVQVARVQTKL